MARKYLSNRQRAAKCYILQHFPKSWQFIIVASLLAFKEDGTMTKVEMQRLSDNDQEWVREEIKKRRRRRR